MKKTCILRLRQQVILVMIFLFFIPILAKAQSDTYEYVPIPDNAVWSVNTSKFKTFGDTIINNNNYLKVYWQKENSPFEFDINKALYFCALRNDTANKRVYGVYKDSAEVIYVNKNGTTTHSYSSDTTEFLLYDFSLEVGDTITATIFFDLSALTYPPQDPCEIYVYKSICISKSDSLIRLNDSSYRRKIQMEIVSSSNRYSQYWIEGIGSTNGLLSPAAFSSYINSLPFLRLLCYSVNDESLIEFPEYDYDSIPDDCYSIGDISNIKEYNISSEIKLYPNPVHDILTIEIQDLEILFPCRIIIFDILGEKLQCIDIYDKQTQINLNYLDRGIYIIRISQSNKINLYSKIIKY